MSKIKVNDLSKAFGIEELFHGVSFDLAKGDRIGLVGANGAGKTTLLRCIMGQVEHDAGSVQRDASDTIGYVEQQADLGAGPLFDVLHHAFDDIAALAREKQALERTIGQAADEATMDRYGKVVERFERAGGYDYESRIRRVAYGLGFTEEDLAKEARLFSGGQKTRICLAKALLREPDFLFLDEPTNHLDIRMIEWLEDFLSGFSGGVLMISHDRFFLDRTATRILDLDGKTVTGYEGNYTAFQRQKAERSQALRSAYEKQQEKIRQTEEYIRRYRAGIKAKQARGRQSQLNRMERIVLPPKAATFDYFAFHRPPECAQRVAELEDVSLSFGDHAIFSHVNLLIRRGDGVALIGPNGTGKTTLLRVLLGELESATGQVKIGSRVKVGYFSQEHEGLDRENTVLGEIADTFGLGEEQARSYLGAFLFRGDDVYRRVGEMSGGEQSRLAFLKLMLQGANFLVLDEPTNHLDIPAREAVEEALMAFPGTFLVVSHDRYFLDRTANCTLELVDGKLTEYNGNYSYYRERKAMEEREAAEAAEQKKGQPARKEKMTSAEEASSRNASRRSDAQEPHNPFRAMSDEKRQELMDRTEAEIAMAEAELKGLEHEMNLPAVQQDPKQSQAIAEAYAAKEREIEERYAKWEQIMEA